jgi:hypothetical protein
MQNIKVLNIGLGKCGSSLLAEVFKKVSLATNIETINLYDMLGKSKAHILEKENNFEKKLPNNFIIQHRNLFSRRWEFNKIIESFEHVKRNFSDDTTILIVIRNPYDLLNSIYCQSINMMEIIKPNDFFYNEKNDISRKDNKFNLYNFDYKKLISLYKSYFKNVVVIKHEEFNDFEFLKKIFDLDSNFLRSLKYLKGKFYNRSISKTGINFILFLNKFINLEKYQKKIRKNIRFTHNPFYKIKNRILYQFLLREFFQKKFDNIIPYKKYLIEKNSLPIDIDQSIKDYNDLNI